MKSAPAQKKKPGQEPGFFSIDSQPEARLNAVPRAVMQDAY
jgi:hypothetical protein